MFTGLIVGFMAGVIASVLFGIWVLDVRIPFLTF